MPVDVLLGLQWGDEGKGKLVDVLAESYEIVARYQGGANAGHTIVFDNQKFVLHLVPSGIFHPKPTCILGNGVVIDPIVLKKEVLKLENFGIQVRERIIVSERAHLILPSHKAMERASEAQMGSNKIGTTMRGIGPAYTDKTGRFGLRVGDIFRPDFINRYTSLRDKHFRSLEELQHGDFREEEERFMEAIDFLHTLRIENTEALVYKALANHDNILAEGGQGALLDLNLGSYPYVTSSHTTSAGACVGLGVSPSSIRKVIGVFKAYATRVGSGPFPTEMTGEAGENLRKAGNEYGATTGRPRRCGWLDLPLLKYAVQLNGATELVMTKADVLAYMEEIQVCKSYLTAGKETYDIPFDMEEAEIAPVWDNLEGWNIPIDEIRNIDEIPHQLSNYLLYIEKYLQQPVSYLSLGPDRNQIIKLK